MKVAYISDINLKLVKILDYKKEFKEKEQYEIIVTMYMNKLLYNIKINGN